MFVRLLLISAPFLAAVGGDLLAARADPHDINYYLAQKPPEFKAAVFGVGILLTTLALIILRKDRGLAAGTADGSF